MLKARLVLAAVIAIAGASTLSAQQSDTTKDHH